MTGVYEGEELRAERRKRGTEQRIEHLEGRVDGLDVKLDKLADQQFQASKETGELKGMVGDVVGQLKHLPRAIESLEKTVDRISAGQQAEQLDINRNRRQRITQALGWFFTGGGLVLLLKLLGVL